MVSKVYLASASPRRQALLRQLGIEFEVVVPDIAERRCAGEAAEAYVRRIAAAKAQRALALIQERGLDRWPIVAADTCVVLDGEILGKPRDRAEGEDMLRRLSGRIHEVLTAVAVVHGAFDRTVLNASRVAFRALLQDEITRYWQTGEPADKAGAYALQGRAAVFVCAIEGSYSGIVGLPLYELAGLLNEMGFEVL